MAIPAAAEKAIGYYIGQKGLSKDVATGIAAVLYTESKLDPVSENNTGTETPGAINPHGSYGVAQWNGPRQQKLRDFATKKGADPALVETQLAFVLTEAANSYPKFWSVIQQVDATYTDVINAMVTYYEVPANIPAEITTAMNHAKEFYAETIVPTSTPTPVPAPVVVPPATPTPTPSLAVIQAQVTDAIVILQSVLTYLKGV